MVNNNKKLVFNIDEDIHARFKIALYYDRMGQSTFIKHIIAAYLTNNKHLRNLMDEILAAKLSKAKKRNRKRDRSEEHQIINDFALNEQEIQNIFDLIESENPDL